MKTIYLDADYICHAEMAEGRTVITTELFDEMPNCALLCYRYIPQGSVYEGKTYAVDFVQCVDVKTETGTHMGYNERDAQALADEAELLDEIESLCEELIGG